MTQRPSRAFSAAGPRGTLAARAGARWRALALAAMLAATGGCQLFREAPSPPEPVPETPAAPMAPQPEPATEGDASTVIDLLQDGRTTEARALLERLSNENPDAWLVAKLSRLIDAPVASLVPPPYREIRIEPGQTLSAIANRSLGDPLMFIALARLNEIEVPSRLTVGAVLKVPERSAPAGETVAEPAPPASMAGEAEAVAEFLALSGQPEQARGMLRGLVARGDASDAGRALFVDLTLGQAREAMRLQGFERAVEMIDDARAVLGEETPERTRLEALRAEARIAKLKQRADAARTRGDLVEAYAFAQQAVDVAPDLDAARRLADELRTALIETLHNEALVAWRDRDVDRAIRTWETLLEAVPGFEPARVYVERARRLRSRLDRP
jgi:hypothetical protein